MRVLSNEINADKQLQNEIIGFCRSGLKAGQDRLNAIDNLDDWKTYKGELLDVVKSAFPSTMFQRKNPLNARLVSKYEYEHFRIENIIFDSHKGWEVNATVYLPKKHGKYPGVICPTGHSTKTAINYQRSAQVFARNGYIAISFDPPGVAGEKQYMNDHFTNGLIGYLTGFWSQTHFVIDALRAMDYLETRVDVNSELGFAMTGVSGGGLTTIYCSMLDSRIKACAPVCCLSDHETLHLSDLYTSCPEQFGIGYIGSGIDYSDYMSIIAPIPCLIVAGKKDEVFDYRITTSIYEKTKQIYGLYNSDDIGLLTDPNSGHTYTAMMANQVVGFFNRIMKQSDTLKSNLSEDDIDLIPTNQLMCYPSNKVNMHTINRDMAICLRQQRGNIKSNIDNNIYKVLGLEKNAVCLNNVKEMDSNIRWNHIIKTIDISVEANIHIPCIHLRRNDSKKRPMIIYFDDKGKWEGLKHDGFLTKATGFLQDERKDEPAVLSIDVTGIGELYPAPTSYDLAYWNDIERILTYLSIAANKSIMGLRVRDALTAIEYAVNNPLVVSENIIIAGSGIGAIVALHAAYIWGKAKKVVLVDMLSRYEELTENFPFNWRQSIVIPEILKYYDLPDLINTINCSDITILNPKDAQKQNISQKKADSIYNKSIKKGVNVLCELTDSKLGELLLSIL